MKTIHSLAQNLIKKHYNIDAIVDHVATEEGWKKIAPVLASKIWCSTCGSCNFAAPFVDPDDKVSDSRVRICVEPLCKATTGFPGVKGCKGTAKHQRALEWPLFCELNNIGDDNIDVSFEKIEQPFRRIEFLKRFAQAPNGVIVMQGTAGLGKTYAAMATCELFTRTKASCKFITQRQLHKEWLQSFRMNDACDVFNKCKTPSLLVIDDFGVMTNSENFMSAIHDLLSYRVKSKGNGTIITTNLREAEMVETCGEGLADRILSGTNIEFKGESRRGLKL